MNQELLEQLRQPFPPSAISWLPGSTTKDGAKCMAMAYADLRVYMERLDDVMGLDWSVRYTFWGDKRIACELTLYVGDALGRREGITRSSIGEFDATDEKSNIAGTVAEAQAFKRAAAMFGLGRYLYELPAAWVAFDAAGKKISKEGQTELDNRYKAWYTKKMAATVKRSVDSDTGEISEGDVLFTKDDRASVYNEFAALGHELYGDQWQTVSKRNAKRISGGKTDESVELTSEQLQRLIVGMLALKDRRGEAQEPIATVA